MPRTIGDFNKNWRNWAKPRLPRKIPSPPTQRQLDLREPRKPLSPEVERKLFGQVEFASALPADFLKGKRRP
jgi:hypothetical protein